MRKLTDDELVLLGTGAYTLKHFTLDEMEDYTLHYDRFETEMGENGYTNKPLSQWTPSGQEALVVAFRHPCIAFALTLLIHRHVGVPKRLWAYESMGYNCEVFTGFMLTFLDVIGKSHPYGKDIWVASVEYYIANDHDAAKLRVYLEDIKSLNFEKLIRLQKKELKDFTNEILKGEYEEAAKGVAYGIQMTLLSQDSYLKFPNNLHNYEMIKGLIAKCKRVTEQPRKAS